jgi:hypothetical protein
LKSLIAKSPVTISLSTQNLQTSPYFGPPEGLTIVDITNPYSPVTTHMLNDFSAAHNVYLEENRGLLYVCGMSALKPGTFGEQSKT